MKYSASQNFYYTQPINEIMNKNRSTLYIRYKDTLSYDNDEDQFFK